VSLAALVASGCSTSRFSSMDDQQPAPLTPAPSGTVTQNQLPPPAAPGTTDPSQFPTAPKNTQVASLPPDGSAPAGASDLTTASRSRLQGRRTLPYCLRNPGRKAVFSGIARERRDPCICVTASRPI